MNQSNNINLTKQKQQLKKIALNNYSNGAEMYRLINEGYLDHIIANITEEKTYTNSTAIVKKGYLTGNEQFIDILAEFLHWFEEYFIVLQHKEWYIANLIEKTTPSFLLCKKYWGDNQYIPYYKKNMTKIFVKNFYDNIKFIYDEFEDFFIKSNITKNMSLNKNEDIDKLLELMSELIWCSFRHNQHSFDCIFANYKYRIMDLKNKSKNMKSRAEQIIYKNYIIHWGIIIENYNKYIDIIKPITKM